MRLHFEITPLTVVTLADGTLDPQPPEDPAVEMFEDFDGVIDSLEGDYDDAA